MNRPYRYCTNCGSDIGSDYRFCVNCGNGIKRRVRGFSQRIRGKVSFQRGLPKSRHLATLKRILDFIVGIFIISTFLSGIPGVFIAIFVYLTYKNLHRIGKKQVKKRRNIVTSRPVNVKPNVQPIKLTLEQRIVHSIKQGEGDIIQLSNKYYISLREIRKIIRLSRENGELKGWYTKNMDYFVTKQELKRILRTEILGERSPMYQFKGLPVPPRGQPLRQSIF
jgi:hypothetical protein